ncbi:TonB-dependent receptor [Aliiglaciecola sp. LCG003]|uniref:TonB-dependent receptor domain-containing protein n=1 Tax=Aliiglaciecola sp. LCG003 TaxID=3053655 RepID=UPI002572CE3D|nr:TonB-dependent receptor [Aliiglaciecola sp. LCG003]WJG08766.1 outer membrane beta-barrel protein [Aliiglaciecola sp. LCG003]
MKTKLDSMLRRSRVSLAVVSVLCCGTLASDVLAQSSEEDAAIEEVVATGTRLKGTASAVLQERQNQAFVADILGAEQISRTGDGDAASALRRVTGLTLVDGKFIYVRGLGERYSSTQLNGMTVPSPDPTRSVVPLDLFPSDIIESLNVQKSFSPNMPGHFGGGNVNIRTKSIPTDFVFSVSGGLGYNTEDSNDGYFYAGGGDDWTGRDDGTRALPDAFANALAASGSAGIEGSSSTTLADTQALLSSLNWDIGPDPKSIDPDFNVGATLGNVYDLDNGSVLGFLATVSYSNEWAVTNEKNGSDIGGGCDNSGARCFTKALNGPSTEQSVRWSGMFNVGYEYDSNNKIELVNMILHDMRDRVRYRDYFDANESEEGVTELSRLDIIFEEREMVSSQLKGTHNLPNWWNSYFDWYAGTSRASRDAPDILEVTFEKNFNQAGEVQFEGLQDLAATNLVRQYQTLQDTSDTWGFNAAVPIFGDGYEVELKFGSDYYEKTRDAENIDIGIRHFGINDTFKQGQRLDQIFTPENIANSDFYLSSTGRGLFQDNTGNGDKYSAASKLEAYYFMADAFISNSFRVSGGVRWERFQQVSIPYRPHSDIFAIEREEILESVYNEDDLFPSLALTYIMDEEMQFRVNVSQTVIRPDLRDISASFFIDPLTEFLVRGSPLLQQAELDNLDLRWEWYKPTGNNLSVALFYKDMANPIEMIELSGGEGVPQLLTANAETGELYGVEFEFLQDLTFISSDLSNFFMSGNITLSDSEVKIGRDDDNSLYNIQLRDALNASSVTTPITNDVRRLVGHSEWVVNMQLGWDSLDGEHSASLVYNSFGERIIVPGVSGNEDAQEQPFHSLDLVYTYYPDFNTTVKFKIQNILGEEKEITQEGLQLLNETVGTSFSASLSWDF